MFWGWDKIKISEIRKDALNNLFKQHNGEKVANEKVVKFYYYILPIVVSVVLLSLGVTIKESIASYLVTGISIFAGLFFSLLITVSDKMNKRKELQKSLNEIDINYFKLYKKFSEQLIAYISYEIVLSVILIVLILFTFLSIDDFNFLIVTNFTTNLFFILNLILNFLIFYYGIKFLYILLIILSSMYVMLLDDINTKE
ncbi:hypothetical protein [Flavobacterium solisilvae]|uniref:ABC transporter permease n=1 Tax=Flavobacterium solisilvae TaxID=1852019 RepID=A0ABX1QSA1_9FLAO|nr:hypothetical protein [Flavobacterium solisilvae]NMH23895.1 hypothetical protein [Flavobacterium solisilvae]